MIKIISNPDEIHLLKNDWNKLAEPFRTPTLRYEWFAACAEAFCKPGQLRIVVINSQRGVTAIAPLVLTRKNGMERLELLGMSLLFETGGFIYKDEESLRELIDAVFEMKRPLVLRRIKSGSKELSVMRQACQRNALIRFRSDAGTPFVPITMSRTEFESSMSSSKRASLKRKQRQADKYGKVDFKVVSPDPDNIDPYLQEAFRVEASGWKGKNGTAILSVPSLLKFFTAYAHAMAHSGKLRLYFLSIDGKAIAVQIAVEYAECLWELKIGYDEKWARCSPGLLLTHETIMHALENGLETYEFLGNDAHWIRIWTDRLHSYSSLFYYPGTLGGILCYCIDSSRFAIGRLLKIKRGDG